LGLGSVLLLGGSLDGGGDGLWAGQRGSRATPAAGYRGHPVGRGRRRGSVALPMVELVAAAIAAGAARDEEGGGARAGEGEGMVKCLLGRGRRPAADPTVRAAGDEDGGRRGGEKGEGEEEGDLIGRLQR
jgi:hypothetical protein